MIIRQDIERFHILFCKSLLTAQDKSLIVLKGGCNLRFFLGSNRYSEDIDFDMATIARDTLRKRVEKVLNAQTLRTSLAASKIELVGHTAPKQTDTVQRWKVSLRANGVVIPSKIEFSRRGFDHGVLFQPIDPLVLADYQLTPTFMAHYDSVAAILQKIEALAGRTEPQTRDVYDLGHLLSRTHERPLLSEKNIIELAIENTANLNYDQFHGQVVEFLEKNARHYYESSTVWEQLKQKVIEILRSFA